MWSFELICVAATTLVAGAHPICNLTHVRDNMLLQGPCALCKKDVRLTSLQEVNSNYTEGLRRKNLHTWCTFKIVINSLSCLSLKSILSESVFVSWFLTIKYSRHWRQNLKKSWKYKETKVIFVLERAGVWIFGFKRKIFLLPKHSVKVI